MGLREFNMEERTLSRLKTTEGKIEKVRKAPILKVFRHFSA
jgi:hypothetical protein